MELEWEKKEKRNRLDSQTNDEDEIDEAPEEMEECIVKVCEAYFP